MSQIAQCLRLVMADLRHDRVAAFCEALALASILLPLMVLLGLRAGVIGTLIERMDRDPAMRLILPEVTGANRFDQPWFERWSARPEVGFLLPNTRAIAGQVDLIAASGQSLRVSLNPTAPGDPLGGGAAAGSRDLISLSSEAARRLSLQAGDKVGTVIERTRAARVEIARMNLTVAIVLPTEVIDGTAAYVGLPVLLDIQAFRDGYQVAGMGETGNGPAPAVDAFPLFRLYARSIRDVAPLAAALRAEGLQISAREGEILSTLRLDRNLSVTLGIIAAAAGLGAGVSLLASQLAALQRKRRDLAVLKLIGYGPSWLAVLPVAAVTLVCIGALLLALPLFALTAGAINDFFASSLAPGEAACRLDLTEMAMLSAATVLVALPSGLVVGLRAMHIDPAQEIRDV